MRILSVAANVALLFAASIILLAFPSNGTPDTSQHFGLGIFSLISALLLAVLMLVEFVSMLTISTSTAITVFIAMFLSVFAFFSPDMVFFYREIGWEKAEIVQEIASEIGFVGTELTFLIFFRQDYLQKKGQKLPLYPLFVAAAINIALYVLLFDSRARILGHFFFLFVAVVFYVITDVRCAILDADNAIFGFSAGIFFACAGLHTANSLCFAGILPYVNGLSVSYIWICILCFIGVYIAFFVMTDKKASKAEAFRQQNNQLKMKVLVGQMKPHFIFNALTKIKSMYHTNLQEGDSTLELFSDYMRESLSLLDNEIVSFETELQKLARYVDFINTGKKNPFNVIYNVDVTDFCLPAFSLQPFIENALKYSKVNEKQDGFIMISSEEVDGLIEVKITDNGNGFDTSQIKDGTHGINNSKERLRLLFDTEPVITSVVGKGTQVTIRLKKTKGGENRLKVIVVDDEMSALHAFLNEIIEEYDVDYKFYKDDAASVCKYVAENRVDAAFLDINMPKINGVELAEKLSDIAPSLKIVFTTGLSVTEEELPPVVRKHTVGFLYKPYNVAKLGILLSKIQNKKRVLKVEMFDSFDCFVDSNKIKFSSSKSKELFALLLAYNGKTLTMGDAIAHLWPDSTTDKGKILYRDAVWRLRKTLESVEIPCVEWQRAKLDIDKSLVSCDYWDYLLTGEGNCFGEFCKQYDWSVEFLAHLDSIRKKHTV